MPAGRRQEVVSLVDRYRLVLWSPVLCPVRCLPDPTASIFDGGVGKTRGGAGGRRGERARRGEVGEWKVGGAVGVRLERAFGKADRRQYSSVTRSVILLALSLLPLACDFI